MVFSNGRESEQVVYFWFCCMSILSNFITIIDYRVAIGSRCWPNSSSDLLWWFLWFVDRTVRRMCGRFICCSNVVSEKLTLGGALRDPWCQSNFQSSIKCAYWAHTRCEGRECPNHASYAVDFDLGCHTTFFILKKAKKETKLKRKEKKKWWSTWTNN